MDIGLENAGVEYDRSGIHIDTHLATSSRHIFAAGAVTGRSESTSRRFGSEQNRR